MQGRYNIYRGKGSAAAIDYDTPVGTVAAGVASVDLVGLGHVEGTAYYYAARAVSDAGVESATGAICRVRVDGGVVGDQLPNKLLSAIARPAAGGRIEVEWLYSSQGEKGVARAVEVALVTGGVADWDDPLATYSIRGTTARRSVVPHVFADATSVVLALRATAANGSPGPEIQTAAVVVDSTPPAAVAALGVEVVG